MKRRDLLKLGAALTVSPISAISPVDADSAKQSTAGTTVSDVS